MSTLTGQTILIIGGTSGIGFGIADASLQSGAATVIVASSSSAKVDKAVERLRANSSNHQTVKGVVIDGKDLASLEQVVKSVGTINHLVFTSGDTIGQVMGRNITTLDIPTLKGERSSIPSTSNS
jgi:NAD(P)-dependent dehydrogenase (short-subunit alcohol dehydrogenase family)